MDPKQSRRSFLQVLAGTALTATAGSIAAPKPAAKPLKKSKTSSSNDVLAPGSDDALRTIAGMESHILIAWNTPFTADGRAFGYNNDFLTCFRTDKPDELLLWANHEYPCPLFVSGYNGGVKSKAQVDLERQSVGGSLLHLRKNGARWDLIPRSPRNFRVDGATPIPFHGGIRVAGSTQAIGTLGNCAGGQTPWGTVLTCEENYHEFYGDTDVLSDQKITSKYGWEKYFPQPPEHYGWVVEINITSRAATKLTQLGRMAHECATVARAKDGRIVVYTGDDKKDEHLYKFISASDKNLDTGILYVADTAKGIWLPLVRDQHPSLKQAFNSQLDMLIKTRKAAKIVGATPLNRPEDIKIHPSTGDIVIALTNNQARGDMFGSLLQLREDGSDHGSLTFRAETLQVGGPQSGFACPDNLAFDKNGNLWMTSDIDKADLNRRPYEPFGNNGLFFIAARGKNAGKAKLVASAPIDAEFSGPCFAPDYTTLFLSVQHPGETSPSLEKLTSHWPDGGNTLPKSAVVALRGEALERLIQS